MATRSFVAVMSGTVYRAVYVHYDGYLEGVGQSLLNYNTQAEVEQLISYGDRSSLNEGFYRDRGETDVDPQEFTDIDQLITAAFGSGAEYYYVFRDGVWYYGNCYGTVFSPLLDDLERK